MNRSIQDLDEVGPFISTIGPVSVILYYAFKMPVPYQLDVYTGRKFAG